ncbi:MAG TPA: hypothetical protein PLN92_04025 [Thermotogota bacterium]|nr:hypothetical protein [Thermotogota bacterium]
MNAYEKMIQLFEEIKDNLSEKDLLYVLELIHEYDTCRGAREANELEKAIIAFCSTQKNKQLNQNA